MPDQKSRSRPYAGDRSRPAVGDSDTHLAGQVALVTGSTLGIGLATAEQLLSRGARVVLNGRDPQRLAHAADRLSALGVTAAVAGDSADPGTVERLIGAADDLGGLHIVVANVGGGTVGRTLADLAEPTLLDSYRGNFAAAALLLAAAAPRLTAQGYGRIVTVSSLAGRRYGRLSGPEYSAHKAAVIGLTRHAAAELAPFGVTVNCVAPGVIRTKRAEGMAEALGPAGSETIERGTPMGRWGEPAEVAAAIVFLAGPSAGYITGHTLDVNGGAFMG